MKTIITIFILFCSLVTLGQSEEAKKLIGNGQSDRAATLLHAHLKTNPSDAEAWYWLAQSYFDKKNIQGALDTLATAPGDVTTSPYFLVAKGQLLLYNGNRAEADALFSKALDVPRKQRNAMYTAVAKAHILNKSGDYHYAVDLLNNAIKKDKKNPGLHILLGNAYRMLHNGSAAYNAYQQALKVDNGSAEANYQLGLLFATQNNTELYLDHFNKSLATNPAYAPALYQLYSHYFNVDPAKSMEYFLKYRAHADRNSNDDYAYTDLLYLNERYNEAIQSAMSLMKNGEDLPRLHKLLAYSYMGTGDTSKALSLMQKYFTLQPDSSLVEKDFDAIATMFASAQQPDSAMHYTERALVFAKDTLAKTVSYKKLAAMAKKLEKPDAEAKWLGLYYTHSPKATNVDLFNWGLAHFKGGNYQQADSVFGLYVAKYPEQGFGYYWRARSNAALDPEMESGLAVPRYVKLIEVLDTAEESETHKSWLATAHGYLAVYETNVKKDYQAAIEHFRKLLEYEPTNPDAEKYIEILETRLEDTVGSK